MKRAHQIYIAIAVVIVAVVAYYLYKRHEHSKVKEEYTSPGDWDLTLDDAHVPKPAYEDDTPTPHFADLVETGDHAEVQPENTHHSIRPLERLSRECDARLLPRTSKCVTPYNIDVADPATHLFQVNLPRVQIKNKQYEMADPYRGDIPIAFHPNVPLVNKSRFGTRDSWRGDGFMSDYSKALYAKYTGSGYLNKPALVSCGETVMDHAVPDGYIN